VIDFSLAEIAVLSASMRDETGRSSAIALEHLTKDDFTCPTHQQIFSVIALHSPDVNEVDVLIALPDLASEISEIAEQYGGGQIERYVDQVIEQRNAKAVEKALLHAQDDIRDPTKSAEDVASAFTTRVAKSLSKRKGQTPIRNAVAEAEAEYLAIDAGGVTAISTGFKGLDSLLNGGFREGCLYVLAARPGVGKSALAIHFTHEAAKMGYRTSYASLEMTASECSARLLTNVSGVPRPTMKNSLNHVDRRRLSETTQTMKKWPITFKDDHEATLESFRAFLAQQRMEGELGLVVVDYLQLLSAKGYDSRTQEVSEISRTMKTLALEYETSVLALSQLNRALEVQKRKPALSDLRESGSIEQDADVVLLLSPDKDDDEVLNCEVAKNRNGEQGMTRFAFEKRLGRFSKHLEPRLTNDKRKVVSF
jgi:replicative DNA helicase